MAEKLDPHFAVFNCHINNAKDRAMATLKAHFPSWHDEIAALDEDPGIMVIFTHNVATPATAAFVALVTHLVNEEPE